MLQACVKVLLPATASAVNIYHTHMEKLWTLQALEGSLCRVSSKDQRWRFIPVLCFYLLFPTATSRKSSNIKAVSLPENIVAKHSRFMCQQGFTELRHTQTVRISTSLFIYSSSCVIIVLRAEILCVFRQCFPGVSRATVQNQNDGTSLGTLQRSTVTGLIQ